MIKLTNIKKKLKSKVLASYNCPVNQFLRLLPTSIHAFTIQKDHKELILFSTENFEQRSCQARASIRRDSCLDARPTFSQHFVCIFPNSFNFDNFYLCIVTYLEFFFSRILKMLANIMVFLSVDNFSENVIFHGIATQEGEILRRRNILRAIHAMYTGKITIPKSYFSS